MQCRGTEFLHKFLMYDFEFCGVWISLYNRYLIM
jgi:hypothetical protein